MFHKEKPKGLPSSQGIGYLITGVVIGVMGVLGVMFFLTLPACACMPQPTETTLPSIATPVPGVTGTAAAQSLPRSERLFLDGFQINEATGQIALSHSKGGQGTFELRSWSGDHVGESILVLEEYTSNFNEFQFHPRQPFLIAYDPLGGGYGRRGGSIFEIDPQTPDQLGFGMMGAFSPDGVWTAKWSELVSWMNVYQTSVIDETGAGRELPLTDVSDVAFNNASTQIAIAADGYESSRIQVYDLDLKLLRDYTIPTTEHEKPYVMFTPDDSALIVSMSHAIYKINLTTSEQQYFETRDSTVHTGIDPTGRWLAVSLLFAAEDYSTAYTLHLYDLLTRSYLPPDPTREYVISGGKSFQFLNDGSLLVGMDEAAISRYQWTGETWGNPTAVMTAADLQ